ncbi:invasion associated locus B family protein [Breoghania sp.]|uniref:invasion associated locus B family protein n=1 Tax=Breoghania sp. TaxID=2065378 RepID=UPI002606F42B|nr:invasion associated locus B family protein [Breoghania sp.]MDJ0929834.1 invasion associated locus B family protein [Breoghania sp.]
MAQGASAALAVLSLTSIASAQTADTSAAQPEAESAWTKVCNTDPKSQKKICMTLQNKATDTGQLLAQVAIREIEGEDRKSMAVIVPPGMLLQPGLRVQIDGGQQKAGKYNICFSNGCVSEFLIDDAFISALKKGNNLVLTTLNQQNKPVQLELTLIGFTKVYESAGLSPQDLQAKQKKLQQELQKRAENARKKLIEQQKKATESE